MRIVTWNVRFGGKHTLKSQIADATTLFGADVLVITEAMLPTVRGNLPQELARAGWEYQLMSDNMADARKLGVLIASKTPIHQIEDLPGPAFMPYRQMAVMVEGFDMEIVGLYVPPVNRTNENKRLFWEYLTEHGPEWSKRPMLIIGDLNTGMRGIDEQHPNQLQYTHRFAELLGHGFVDAYRKLHPSDRTYTWWWPNGSGMRLDHCLVAADHAHRVRFADYLVRVGEHQLVSRGSRAHSLPALSDHAAMIVDFDESLLA